MPPPAENKSPADSPAAAAPPPAVAPVQTADPFGEEIALAPKKVVILKGTANWDLVFDTLMDSFKTLTAMLDKQSIARSGNPMIVYTSTDDTGFTYMAELPVDQDPKNLTKDMSIGKSPEGKALKFVHRGSYDDMDQHQAITNHLDDKKLEAKGHLRRGIHHRSSEDPGGQAGDQRLCAAETRAVDRGITRFLAIGRRPSVAARRTAAQPTTAAPRSR